MRLTLDKGSVNVLISSIVVVLIALLVSVFLQQAESNVFVFGDLRAFYCSARVALAGFDPYLAEPIGACERASAAMPASNFVIPAPLSGATIALIEPLAGLPFRSTAAIWSAILILTFFSSSILVARLTSWPYTYTVAAFLPLGLVAPIELGQLVPLAVVLVVAATLALRGGRDALASMLAATATIEPHIGLPVCVALFIARPRARLPLALAAVAIAAICVLTVGFPGFIEYVGRVLPEHIASEAGYDGQFSLTYLLSWLHVPVANAVLVGGVSYWLVAAAGIGAGIRLSRRSADSPFLLFTPMAASIMVGPYVHVEHLLAALPLAVLVTATSSRRTRLVATLALILVAWPAKRSVFLVGFAGDTMRISQSSVRQAPSPLPLLADAAWATRIAENAGHLSSLIAKCPSWVGLFILAALIAGRVRSALRAAASGGPRTPQSVPRALRDVQQSG